ncbi:MAG: acyl-CoA reductase [Chitinophagaceae bacterium]|nr:acyl-CoA reductase [Chitinophagaceae bacterium]
MNLQHRIFLLTKLRNYILENGASWQEAKVQSGLENGWFIPEFTGRACSQIAQTMLDPERLQAWAQSYNIPDENHVPKTVGIVMAGNIPLVGFHDWLCVFMSGHKSVCKLSSKDGVLLKHLVEQLAAWDPEVNRYCEFAERLKGCDAYIATGSNNSSLYFEHYFSKYPNIIRRNRTSVAILTGNESKEELDLLADDIFLYFGLGCRNVSKIFVPEGYDFIPLLGACKRYGWLADFHKFKNNYDYNLALHILNGVVYMSTENVLVVENPSPFSRISQLHYEFYGDKKALEISLAGNTDLQCVVGKGHVPFGQSQDPTLTDYADGVDTMEFLCRL